MASLNKILSLSLVKSVSRSEYYFYLGNSGCFLREVDVNMVTRGRAGKQMVV